MDDDGKYDGTLTVPMIESFTELEVEEVSLSPAEAFLDTHRTTLAAMVDLHRATLSYLDDLFPTSRAES